MVDRIVPFFITVVLTLLALGTVAADGRVSLDITPESGTVDDEFIFSVIVDGTQTAPYPALSGGNDFDISLIGPQQSVRIINGAVEKELRFNYRLKPLRSGKLKGPSVEITIDGKTVAAPPVTVLVEEPRTASKSGKEEIVLSQRIDRQSAYLGEQVVRSVELATRIPVHRYNLLDTTLDGFWAASFGERDNGLKTIGGYRFRTVREKSALFPLRPGNLEIPQQVAKATVTTSREARRRFPFGSDLFNDMLFQFGARTEEITLRSSALTLEVKPLPPLPADFDGWGLGNVLVGDTTLAVQFDPAPIKFGESKTVNIELSSLANIGPVNDVNFPDLPNLKIYQEAPQASVIESGGMALFVKTVSVSIVPSTGGTVQIPSLELSYFEPERGIYDKARSAPIKFDVIGGPPSSPAPSPDRAEAGAADSAPVNEALQYRAATLAERISDQVSASMILLAVLVLAAVILLSSLVRRIYSASKGRAALRAEIDRADSVNLLDSAFRRLIKERFGIDIDEASSGLLRAELRNQFQQSDMLVLLLSVVDDLERLRFSGEPPAPGEVDEIREKVARIEKLL